MDGALDEGIWPLLRVGPVRVGGGRVFNLPPADADAAMAANNRMTWAARAAEIIGDLLRASDAQVLLPGARATLHRRREAARAGKAERPQVKKRHSEWARVYADYLRKHPGSKEAAYAHIARTSCRPDGKPFHPSTVKKALRSRKVGN